MPNQYNYRQRIRAPLSARYTISRIMQLPIEGIIDLLAPAEFGFYEKEHVMLSLYNPTDNTYISSQRIDLADGILTIKSVAYRDGTFSNYLTVDFTKLNATYPTFLTPGVYDLVIDVMEDMIGSDDDKKLLIDEISDSRTEVKLKFDGFFGVLEREELDNIVYKSIPRPFLGGILDNLLLVANETGNAIIGITAEEILGRMKASESTYFVVENLELQNNYTEVINKILKSAHEKVLAKLQFSAYRLQQNEFADLVKTCIIESFDEFKHLFNYQVTVN